MGAPGKAAPGKAAPGKAAPGKAAPGKARRGAPEGQMRFDFGEKPPPTSPLFSFQERKGEAKGKAAMGKNRLFRFLKREEKSPPISSLIRTEEVGPKRRVRGSGRKGRPPGKAVEGLKYYRVVKDALEVDEGGFNRGAVLSVEELRVMMKIRTITPGTVIEDQERKRFVVKETNEGLQKEAI